MRTLSLTVSLVVLCSAAALAGSVNTPVDAVENPMPGVPVGGTTMCAFPNYIGPSDINAYRIDGLGGATLTVEVSDACLSGDMWDTAIVSLPGPVVLDMGTTSGTAPGCACAWNGFADITLSGAFTSGGVGQRYRAGADVFSASAEIRFSTTAAITLSQIRGSDACGGPFAC